MRAPAFWAVERGGIAAAALTPLSCLYRLGARGHAALARPAKAGLPVICVGNFTVGGAGKTPTVLALAALLAEEGIDPHILTRGYGGSERGPLRVDPARHDARAVGDEALLLARWRQPGSPATGRPGQRLRTQQVRPCCSWTMACRLRAC